MVLEVLAHGQADLLHLDHQWICVLDNNDKEYTVKYATHFMATKKNKNKKEEEEEEGKGEGEEEEEVQEEVQEEEEEGKKEERIPNPERSKCIAPTQTPKGSTPSQESHHGH